MSNEQQMRDFSRAANSLARSMSDIASHLKSIDKSLIRIAEEMKKSGIHEARTPYSGDDSNSSAEGSG